MKYFSVNEIRKTYLDFFESKGHLALPSFSLIPHDDPSILLINAGMTPMKKWFTGAEIPPSKRVTTCQKCIRTPDIDQVGQTARHGTFFEMLGNFSFGDYFKKDAISWAWELLTEKFEMPAERLYVTVFEEDDEAYDLWHKEIGLAPDHILRMGKEDNFWEHGVGPCGPCSEIFFDRGEKYSCGPTCHFGCDCDRFMEIWNLVFTQFDRQEDGTYLPLEHKNIDTGGGLERFAIVLQEVDNFFDVDNIQAILQAAAKMAGVSYGESDHTDIALRVITDHIRSATMMIADGVVPSNEGRGYVLRRLLRRAVRYGRRLGMPEDFLLPLAKIAIQESVEAYPELGERQEIILTHIAREQESFNRTLNQGLLLLEEEIKKAKAAGQEQLSGDLVFKLHDTFGFPYDLTREICAEQGLAVDHAGFEAAMSKQREAGRKAQLAKSASAWESVELPESVDRTTPTEFTGYERLTDEAKLLHILVKHDKQLVDVPSLEAGQSALLIFDRTPFYAESGGQVGDRGIISGENCEAQVLTTTKDGDRIFYHQVDLLDGVLEQGETYRLQVDRKLRLATARNHSATHLLHKALRDTLGNHVEQAGSYVNEHYLRFDFRHFQALTPEEIQQVEAEVNAAILADYPISTNNMDLAEAKASGAMALFSEKYGQKVRVISMGDFSRELCGGTHLQNTSQAAYFRIVSETGIASGVRRIEAYTGEAAVELSAKEHQELLTAAQILKTNEHELLHRLESILDEKKQLEKEIQSIHAQAAAKQAGNLAENAEEVAGIKLVLAEVAAADPASLREAGDSLKNELGNVFLLLASPSDGKVIWLAMASQSAVDKGLNAGKIIRNAAKITGGGGGGRPDMAQAGGKDASKIKAALEAAHQEIIDTLNK
ncbi:MAG: alanine--tRNA ligase [Eubacteriales bacterium]|nr:alanine--tRNA ligase [Eubacteriales bacterium]